MTEDHKFQMGDRVKVTWNQYGWGNRTGTITRVPHDRRAGYQVHLDEPFLGYTDPVFFDTRLEFVRPRPATTRSAVEL